MTRAQRGIAATVDTNVVNPDRFPALSPQTISQTASPVGSLIATPAVSPEPAYIAAKDAGLIITREVLAEFHNVEEADLSDTHESSLSEISGTALVTVNAFLDRILHNILATSRSLSLVNLRNAVKEVLKPRLATQAIDGADEELVECIGDDEDDTIDLYEDAIAIMDGPFDLDLIWRRARLRCMVYTRLGDVEEDDEERYIEEQSLDGYVNGQRMSRNNGLVHPPVAIWLTAILEFIGENALMVSSHAAYKRSENKYGRGLAGQPLHPSVVMVNDSDLEKIALNPTLGRLWRAWRKPLKSPRASISRGISMESMRHRRGDSRSSIGHTREASSETLSSLREPVHPQEHAIADEAIPKDPVAEEPEMEANNQESTIVSEVLEPAQIPLPISEYDIMEIEVPGYTPDPDWEGRREDYLTLSKRPTSTTFPASSDFARDSETLSPKGLRHMRSQSLPGARRPSVYALLEEASTGTATGTGESLAARSTAVDRSVSDLSQAEVFNSLESPADYQTAPPDTKRQSVRRNRASFVPPETRKSAVSEFGGSEGPVLFDRSDYRVEAHEVPIVQTTLMSPQVTVATPTEMPGTPVRSGLRSNRPVSLAINSPNKLAAPQRLTTGEVSPVGEGEYLESGEVSPLDPSDDEGSVLIAGLKDAKEYMGLDPSESAGRDSDAPFEDASEEPAVSPISPPVIPPTHIARAWVEPPASQTHREIAPAAAETSTPRTKQDVPMVRQTSDERRREAIVSPQRMSIEKDELPDIPKEEQIKALAAAAHAHNHVAVPQPANIYRSISRDVSNDGIPQVISAATANGAAPSPVLSTLVVPRVHDVVPSPEPSPLPVLETATTITRVHRREVRTEAKAQSPESRPQYQAQESRSLSETRTQPEVRPQPEPKIHAVGGVTPLQLNHPGAIEASVPPPASKLLERRRQLPQVDTNAPGKAGVQRLNNSPQSPEVSVLQMPSRSVPEQIYSPPTAPQVQPESTPPIARKPASRKTSKSGDDAFGHKSTKSRNSSNERSKDFEQLIDSGETIQYTLTPQNIRSYQAAETAPEAAPMQKSNSRDRTRGLSITGGFGSKSRSNTQTGQIAPSAVAGVASTPGFAGIPVRRPAAATPTTITIQGRKSGLAPREAKTDMSSTRDFADFMRNTGPNGSIDTYPSPQKVVRGPKPVGNNEIRAKPQTAGLPPGMRSPSLESTSGMRLPGTGAPAATRRKGPKLLARDPQTNDSSASDLIDFIRQGPPGQSGAYRAPNDMKSSMGSQSSAANGTNYNRYAPSMNSTQESFKTASGLSSSNSHTGLLASARANPSSTMGGVQEEPMPVRKSRKPRDPYSIDFSDEEEDADEDRLGTPRGGHQREESLVEFLQSQLPPANTSSKLSSLGRPIGNGPGMAKPKPQARAAVAGARSDTNDLADFFKNSAPPGGGMAGHSNHVSVSSVQKEKKGGLGGMFRRARG